MEGRRRATSRGSMDEWRRSSQGSMDDWSRGSVDGWTRLTWGSSSPANPYHKFGRWRLPPKSLDPWSKSGIESQMEGVNGVGLLSPQFVPYRPIGMPDLIRNRSLLPKFTIYKTDHEEEDARKDVYEEVEDEGSHVILPLKIKGCQWNGERWCSTNFSANIARSSNGSNLLQNEVSKSEHRLKRTRAGDYFLSEPTPPPMISPKTKPRVKPKVPPLPLNKVPKFNAYLETERNNAYLYEYHMEARRVASERAKEHVDPTPGIEPAVTGMPAKALEHYSLEQLGSILNKEVEFSGLQHKFNKQLYHFCDSCDSLRSFTFRRKYGTLKKLHELKDIETTREPNPLDTKEQAEVFLRGMEKNPWYKDVAKIAFDGDQNGSRGEWLILNIIRSAVEKGTQFTTEDFVPLLYYLTEQGIDLNDPGVTKILTLMRKSLKVPDLALQGFIETFQLAPEWLMNIYHPRYGRLVSFRKPTEMFRIKFLSRIRSTKFSFL